MGEVFAALGTGGWAIVALVGLLTALLFSPWREPSRRAERLLRAWKGHEEGSPRRSRKHELDSRRRQRQRLARGR